MSFVFEIKIGIGTVHVKSYFSSRNHRYQLLSITPQPRSACLVHTTTPFLKARCGFLHGEDEAKIVSQTQILKPEGYRASLGTQEDWFTSLLHTPFNLVCRIHLITKEKASQDSRATRLAVQM